MKNEIQNGLYKHFKGHVYQVIGVGKHSETLEEYVVYCDTKNKTAIWVRPKEMFLETVKRDGKIFQRFELIESGI